MKLLVHINGVLYVGLPPCGGSGLKWIKAAKNRLHDMSPSVWREWIEMENTITMSPSDSSPSVWREWIEIEKLRERCKRYAVSLRVEGVD